MRLIKRGMIVTNPNKLSECTDMTEERFLECLDRVDMKVFIENPTQALIDAGAKLKEGVTFKLVETEEESNALPANVFPLMSTQKNNEELSMENLDKVAGGHGGEGVHEKRGKDYWCSKVGYYRP
jgi:hypothetical protein